MAALSSSFSGPVWCSRMVTAGTDGTHRISRTALHDRPVVGAGRYLAPHDRPPGPAERRPRRLGSLLPPRLRCLRRPRGHAHRHPVRPRHRHLGPRRPTAPVVQPDGGHRPPAGPPRAGRAVPRGGRRGVRRRPGDGRGGAARAAVLARVPRGLLRRLLPRPRRQQRRGRAPRPAAGRAGQLAHPSGLRGSRRSLTDPLEEPEAQPTELGRGRRPRATSLSHLLAGSGLAYTLATGRSPCTRGSPARETSLATTVAAVHVRAPTGGGTRRAKAMRRS